jgi:Kdo2-lipid IVA lauroyltransferase/acyltransferase
MPKHLRYPKYWPLWLGFGILRLLVLLPYSWQLTLGRGLGSLLYYLLPKRRHIAAVNLKLCFPEKNEHERKTLLKASFKSFGMGIMEAFMAWWMPVQRFNKIPFVWRGEEHYQDLIARGQGIIALGGHFTCLEIAGRCFANKIPVGLTYKASRNPFFEYVLTQGRRRYMRYLVKHTQIKTMVQNLRAQKILWYAPDQDFGLARSVWTSWFGVPAATVTGVSVLAKLGNALVIPVHFRRLAKGGYEAVSFPALDNFPSGNDVQDAQRWQQLLENFVREYPDQYLWLHRRFKTRPEGQAAVY